MPTYRSRTTTHGRNMAGARSLWRATGMTNEDFGKPIIAVVNSFTQFVPGHVHLKDLGQLVAREIVGDIIADPRQGADQILHLVEHAVDDAGELGKLVAVLVLRQPFAEIAGDNALNPHVDLLDPPLRSHADQSPGDQAEAQGRQQTERQRLTDHARELHRQLTLTFSEGLEAALSGATITLAGQGEALIGNTTLKEGDGKTLIVPLLAPLGVGTYTVNWHALSKDGHATHDSYSFTVAP